MSVSLAQLVTTQSVPGRGKGMVLSVATGTALRLR